MYCNYQDFDRLLESKIDIKLKVISIIDDFIVKEYQRIITIIINMIIVDLIDIIMLNVPATMQID